MPKIYAVISGSIVAVLGVLGTNGVMDPGLATAISSVIALVVTQIAHNATPPAAKV